MKRRFLFISCEEAFEICDKLQYGEASYFEKIKLKLRMSWCHITKSYSSRNTDLTAKIKEANINCLNKNEKETISKIFKSELAKHR